MGTGQVFGSLGATPLAKALTEIGTNGPPKPSAVPPPSEYLRLLGALPLLHQPGDRWMYNTGSDVLGVLVARASDQPFGTFLRERLFDPLGMTDTGFSVPVSARDRLPAQYMTDFTTGQSVVYDEPDGDWAASRPSHPALAAWYRRSATTPPSPRCSAAGAYTKASASCPGRPSS